MRIDNSVPAQTPEQPQEAQGKWQTAQSTIEQAVNNAYEALRNDQGATDTVEQMKSDESREDFNVECNEQGMMFLVPTDNQLTGEELSGYVLQGTMDKGNELNELQQFQAAGGQMAGKMDPAAERVMNVVDKWVATMQANGQTEMTPEQKAQFAAELSEAAKPRGLDGLLGNPIITQPSVDPLLERASAPPSTPRSFQACSIRWLPGSPRRPCRFPMPRRCRQGLLRCRSCWPSNSLTRPDQLS